jgi:hypothetical protein
MTAQRETREQARGARFRLVGPATWRGFVSNTLGRTPHQQNFRVQGSIVILNVKQYRNNARIRWAALLAARRILR